MVEKDFKNFIKDAKEFIENPKNVKEEKNEPIKKNIKW